MSSSKNGASMRLVKPARTKIPLREVKCDDFVVYDNGMDYYPHFGESVWFRGRVSLDTFTTSLRLAAFADLQKAVAEGDHDPEMVAEMGATMSSIAEQLVGMIGKWNWTDDDSAPYPEHPTADTIKSLPLDELLYLVQAGFGGSAANEGSAPNA